MNPVMRPILFNTEMVRAIQSGQKTQTRRIIKPQPSNSLFDSTGYVVSLSEGEAAVMGSDLEKVIKCPFGKEGDLLYVREKWRQLENCETGAVSYDHYAEMPEDFHENHPASWKPSIHMPKAAIRLYLLINQIEVQQIQSITNHASLAEGIEQFNDSDIISYKNYLKSIPIESFGSPYHSFQSLWESIYGSESWEENPWVWVVKFELLMKEQVLKYLHG